MFTIGDAIIHKKLGGFKGIIIDIEGLTYIVQWEGKPTPQAHTTKFIDNTFELSYPKLYLVR